MEFSKNYEGYIRAIAAPNSRALESMNDEEAQECLIEVFLVSPHLASYDVEQLKRYLCENIEFELGSAEEGLEEQSPLGGYSVTPQTYFNLTIWLLKRGFNLFGL